MALGSDPSDWRRVWLQFSREECAGCAPCRQFPGRSRASRRASGSRQDAAPPKAAPGFAENLRYKRRGIVHPGRVLGAIMYFIELENSIQKRPWSLLLAAITS